MCKGHQRYEDKFPVPKYVSGKQVSVGMALAFGATKPPHPKPWEMKAARGVWGRMNGKIPNRIETSALSIFLLVFILFFRQFFRTHSLCVCSSSSSSSSMYALRALFLEWFLDKYDKWLFSAEIYIFYSERMAHGTASIRNALAPNPHTKAPYDEWVRFVRADRLGLGYAAYGCCALVSEPRAHAKAEWTKKKE